MENMEELGYVAHTVLEGNTLLDIMNLGLPMWQQALLVIRLAAAMACGAIIGIERSRRYKEAGIRTHIIVAAAAALFMMVSKYGFADLEVGTLSFLGTKGADPSRIASQVVSGISFLGAGIIFRNGNSIRGLTTAAGVWATAAIGMTIGAGLYIMGFAFSIIILLMQIAMHRFTIGGDSLVSNHFTVTVVDSEDFRKDLYAELDRWQVQIVETDISRNPDGTLTMSLSVRMRNKVQHTDIIRFFDLHPEVTSFSLQQNG
jgi:putative Mg2+ transporter-C (MgtC) family protein